MKEDLLSYIWRYRLWSNKEVKTTDGEEIDIIDVGTLNTDAGPDYFNAKIKKGDTVWAGNVEIHVNSSDWNKHKHQTDHAYDNVILHVVNKADCEVKTAGGNTLPQIELDVDEKYLKLDDELCKGDQSIPCSKYWDEKLKFKLQFSVNGLLIERLQSKVGNILNTLGKNKGDWEETLYQIMAKSIGMKVNEFPFHQLTLSLPFKYIAKHRNNLLQVESMIIGQAGLLNDIEEKDEYTKSLVNEYRFMRQKFDLTPIDKRLWKFARMRPLNSPYLRLAEFAMLIYKTEHLFSRLTECKEIKDMHKLLNQGSSKYWDTHYTLGAESNECEKTLGSAIRNSILINCVAPIIFAYGKSTGNEDYCQKAIDMLGEIPAESNHIVSEWASLGVESKSAYDTQALIQLKKMYCDKKDCLRCKLGIQVYKKVCG